MKFTANFGFSHQILTLLSLLLFLAPYISLFYVEMFNSIISEGIFAL